MYTDRNSNYILEPFFTFYGGKWRTATRYPAPKYEIIVEPFAGSAGYSMRHPSSDVILVDRDPNITNTWKYLVSVSESEILSLPDLEIGDCVDNLPVCEEAKLLIGWWCGRGRSSPGKSISGWGRDPRYSRRYWGVAARNRIAEQLKYIRHWSVIEDSYENVPPFRATWFVDPPYVNTGYTYRYNRIDKRHLSEWCLSLEGQVIVCEGDGANWLPFEQFGCVLGNNGYTSRESIFQFET